MRKVLVILLVVVFSIGLTGCGVKDTVYKEAEKDKILQQIRESNLSEEDRRFFAQAIVRESFGGEKLEGKTIGDIIDEQKKIKEEADRKVAEAKAKQEALEKATEGALQVSVENKQKRPKNIYAGIFRYATTCDMLVVNTSGKDIQAFKGYFEYKNLIGEDIIKTAYYDDQGLPANESRKIPLVFEINEFKDNENTLYNTDLDKMKVTWKTTAIVFKDGTTVGEVK